MTLLLVYLLESFDFPPKEDLRDLSDPDDWMPVSDCLLWVLALAVTGDLGQMILVAPLMGVCGSIRFCWFLQYYIEMLKWQTIKQNIHFYIKNEIYTKPSYEA